MKEKLRVARLRWYGDVERRYICEQQRSCQSVGRGTDGDQRKDGKPVVGEEGHRTETDMNAVACVRGACAGTLVPMLVNNISVLPPSVLCQK